MRRCCFKKLLTEEGQTNDGHPMITNAHIEYMAQVS